MGKKANQLYKRLNNSANLTMSPLCLFADKAGAAEDSIRHKRRHNSQLDEFNQQAFASLCKEAVNGVKTYLDFCDACPEVITNLAQNRFLQQEEKKDEQVHSFHPVLRSNVMLMTYVSVNLLHKTQRAVVYKGRHRLTGDVHCIKRSL